MPKPRSTARIAALARVVIPLSAMFALAGCSWLRAPGTVRKPGPKSVTLESLVNQMPDLDGLARFPDPPYTVQQSSSYDPKSKTPGNEDWFANADVGQYIRVEDRGDRKEYVMLDAKGPGVVVRIWSANPQGRLRFYLNGAEEPVFTVGMEELLGGRNALFPSPIAGLRAAGWNLYFPIGYSKSIKITSDHGKFYYHVNYRTYPEGTRVEDFNPESIRAMSPAVQAMMARLEAKDRPVESLKSVPHTLLPAGKKVLLYEAKGAGKAVDYLAVHAESNDLDRTLRGVLLTLEFDGPDGASSEVPLGDFFGSTPGINPYATLPLGMLDDGTMYSRWVMPFKRQARIYATNVNGGDAVSIVARANARKFDGGFDASAMYFHAGWKPGFDMPTRPMRDFNFVQLTGKGVFVGDSLGVANPVRQWWGEGDEKIYFDGQTFPSTFGTGTEDYYGYAWCNTAKFIHPYHSQSRCDGPNNYGHTSVNRFHIFDGIPFTKDFKFDMEVWHWADKVTVSYAATSYWYARPGAKSNLGTPRAADLVVPVIEPIPVFRAEGAIEAESMTIGATGGRTAQQDMGGFTGRWSGNTHLWWRDGRIGDTLSFKLDCPAEGRFEVFANFTKAVDYGTMKVEVNGTLAAERIDFYADKIGTTGEISLGVHDLAKYNNIVRFTIIGANEKAHPGNMAGVDYFRLKPVRN